MKKIYLYNRGNTGNIGDFLINAIIKLILQNNNCSVFNNPIYGKANNKMLRLWNHVKSYTSDFINILHSDLTVIGGGNLIMDQSGLGFRWAFHHFWVASLCLFFQKPYYYLCVGVAPLNNKAARWFYRFTMKYAKKISVRDSFSKKYLMDFSKREDIVLMFDPVLLVSAYYPQPRKPANNSALHIGICPVQLYPTIVDDKKLYADYISLHKKLIQKLLKTYKHITLFLNDPKYDILVYQDIITDLDIPKDNFSIRQNFLSTHEYLQFISQLDLVISSRMHALICATSYGIPGIGLGWQPKMRYFFKDLGIPGHIDLINLLSQNLSVNMMLDRILSEYHKLEKSYDYNLLNKQLEGLNLKDFLSL